MKKILVTASILALTLALVGCGSSDKKGEGLDSIADAPEQANEGDFNFGVNDDSDSGKLPIKTVYFGYNSSSLSGDTTSTLDGALGYLQENAGVQVRVEGHCDERGGAQYNFALGENRAQAVKKYLTANGLDAGRVEIISYGKERPVAFGHDEGSWSQNRRGNFVITAK